MGPARWCCAASPAGRGALLAAVQEVAAQAPFRHMVTPGGFRMSVAMTNCGTLGWVTDRTGYRYDAVDPDSGRPGRACRTAFLRLAQDAAAQAGFGRFVPDACLVNRYEPGTRLSLHQDRNERDFGAPIVSVSLGLPAVFLFGGTARARQAATRAARARRRGGVGRPGAAALPRRAAAQGGISPAGGRPSHQSDVPQGGLKFEDFKAIVVEMKK